MADGYSESRARRTGCGCYDGGELGHLPECPRYPIHPTEPARCEARNADGQQCGTFAGHDGLHTTLIETRYLHRAQPIPSPTSTGEGGDVPDLLRTVADFVEAETIGTFVGVADRLRSLAVEWPQLTTARTEADAAHVKWHDEVRRLEREREEDKRELSDISAAIGTCEFMDPPDGGDVSLAEQVRRMRAEIKRQEDELEYMRRIYRHADESHVSAVAQLDEARATLAARDAELAGVRELLKLTPDADVLAAVRVLHDSYMRVTARLQDACQRHGLGLGGEQVDGLVVEALDAALALLREARPLVARAPETSNGIGTGRTPVLWRIDEMMAHVDLDAARSGAGEGR